MNNFLSSFGSYFSQSLKALRSRFGLFFQIILVFTALSFGLEWAASYLDLQLFKQLPGWQSFLLSVVFILIGIAFSVVTSLASTYASNQTLHHREVDLGKIFTFSFQNFWKGLSLSVKIFLFILIWVALLMLIVVGLGLLFGIILVVTSRPADAFSIPEYAVIPIGIAAALFMLYRIVQAAFSYYFLIDQNLTPKESLHQSVSVVRKNIWRILGYMALYGIIIISVFIGAGLLMSFLLDGPTSFITEAYFSSTEPAPKEAALSPLVELPPKEIVFYFVFELFTALLGMLYVLFANVIYLKFRGSQVE